MKAHILDDWFDTLRGFPCFEKLKGNDVTVRTDHVEDTLSRLQSRQHSIGRGHDGDEGTNAWPHRLTEKQEKTQL